MIKLLLTLLLLFAHPFISYVLAQDSREVLVEKVCYPALEKEAVILKSTSTIELPFFDDFSKNSSTPNPNLWEGKHVFTNMSYAINPPTIGVATFDAIGMNGKLHQNASNFPFSSDTLSSQLININYPNDTTIYLSFWYQPQGLGNQPQTQDSLVLEYYDVNADVWIGAWAVSVNFSSKTLREKNKLAGTTKTLEADNIHRTFFRVHLPIKDGRFLNSSFRFRFRNYASLMENAQVPSIRGNCDHWHVDLVYLNRNRNYSETSLNDIAIFKPIGSILANYENIPWSHFNSQAQSTELTNPLVFPVSYRNLGPSTWNITRMFQVKNHSTNQTTTLTGAADNIFAYQDITFNRNYIYNFQSAWADSAVFTFTSYIETDVNPDTYPFRWNDTIRHVQRFHNFYAYDDGTAEMGYGLYGEGSQNGQVAVRFHSYQSDSLVGIYMYFNRTLNDANQKFFKLAVWEDNNGKPGNLLYEQIGARPIFTDSLNSFTLYKFSEKVWIEAGSFFVGWIKTTTDMLNVGFDMNKVNNDKVFFNLSGVWQSSQFEGSVMIRPVFGELTQYPTSVHLSKNKEFNIYPNPATNSLYLDFSSQNEPTSLKVFNVLGQMVLCQQIESSVIDISRIPQGTYIVSLFSGNRKVGNRKLVIAR